jgi:hypothetical protein
MAWEPSMLKGLLMSQNANKNYIEFVPKTFILFFIVLIAPIIIGCSGRLHLHYQTDLSGTKVWGEQNGEKIEIVVSLPHPEGAQIPQLTSLDEPFSFTQKAVSGTIEFRFTIEAGRLTPKKSIRLSIDYGGGPSTLILQGPVRTTGQSTANTIFWTLISGI